MELEEKYDDITIEDLAKGRDILYYDSNSTEYAS